MENNFWKKLAALQQAQGKPFFVLAPMADVTDMAFRQIVTQCGKPDVLFTEFVSCDGLCSENGKPKLMPHLKFGKNERPIVAQFFGADPKNFYKCAKLAVELEFDGIDINMGCPDKKVRKQGGGAALILKPELAKEIIRETKRGAGDLPISVKTRLGYNKIITKEWVSHLIKAKPAAIIIHGRTQKEMSKVPAHWGEIGKAAALCRKAGILIIGNGDIATRTEGIEKAKQYDLDGIMVGRGIFSNPWFFNVNAENAEHTPKERIELLKKHIKLFIKLWGNSKNFETMKRFFKIYISNWPGAKELRIELMTAKNKKDVVDILSREL